MTDEKIIKLWDIGFDEQSVKNCIRIIDRILADKNKECDKICAQIGKESIIAGITDMTKFHEAKKLIDTIEILKGIKEELEGSEGKPVTY